MGQENLKNALADLKEDDVYKLVEEQINNGVPAKEILKSCQSGMKTIGDRFKTGEYFIADMMYAGEIMRQVMDRVTPYMKGTEVEEKIGTVVIGTVKGDIHDLGKDVVIIALQGYAFDVVDLGVDVPPKKFVEAVKAHNAEVVGMSCFLTPAFLSAEETVKAIEEAGLRDKVRIMIGGAPVTGEVAERIGCDFFGEDAVAGVNYAREVVGAG
jgi:5-methyltetrahydrofolate--homocysteine methyltransferase